METVIATEGLCKNFGEGELQIKALKDVDLSIVSGEFTAIVGPSGSGKTTLLNILCGLDVPSSGEIRVSGNPSTLNGSELARFRRVHIGLVFQAYNLIPVLTVMENIEYVMLLQEFLPKKEKTGCLSFCNGLAWRGRRNGSLPNSQEDSSNALP